jgi:uncharacterized protein (DUF488 family)
MSQIFTIGHSNRQWSEFTRLLEDNHVVAIGDVRRHPGSKSFPQFNEENMANESSPFADIEKIFHIWTNCSRNSRLLFLK